MVIGTPSTKIIQIILIDLKISPPGGVAVFSYVGETLFFKSEIARSCKGDNSSWLKSFDLEP